MQQATVRSALKELVRCYQAFEAYASANIHRLGLTVPQFDIIVTLGNAQGMTPKELGEQTWITKGTLTGVIDRLQAKGLVKRTPSTLDRRSQIITLTKKGQKLFDKVFPEHLAYIGRAFRNFKAEDLLGIEAILGTLRRTFDEHKPEVKE